MKFMAIQLEALTLQSECCKLKSDVKIWSKQGQSTRFRLSSMANRNAPTCPLQSHMSRVGSTYFSVHFDQRRVALLPPPVLQSA